MLMTGISQVFGPAVTRKRHLWTGDEIDSDEDIPTKANPNERVDRNIDKVFEFDEMPKFKTISEHGS